MFLEGIHYLLMVDETIPISSSMQPCFKIKLLTIENCLSTVLLCCRQLIYNYPEQLFSDAGVMAIEHADFEGIEQLALVLGGDIVSTFGSPDKVKLGSCKLIEEIMIGEDKVGASSAVVDPLSILPPSLSPPSLLVYSC